MGVCTNPDCREVFMLESCERCSAYANLSNLAWCDQCESYMQHVIDKD